MYLDEIPEGLLSTGWHIQIW